MYEPVLRFFSHTCVSFDTVNMSQQVDSLKSQLTSPFAIYNDHGADFWEFTYSQKSTHYSMHCVKWLWSWHLSIFAFLKVSLLLSLLCKTTMELTFCEFLPDSTTIAFEGTALKMIGRLWESCIHIYICICMCIYIYIHMYIYMHIPTYIYIYIYVWVYIYMCKHMHVYIYIHIYVYICIYIYMFIYKHIFVYMYAFSYTHIYIYVMCVYIYIYINVYMYHANFA